MPVSTRRTAKAMKAIAFSPFVSGLSGNEVANCVTPNHNKFGIKPMVGTLLFATPKGAFESPEEKNNNQMNPKGLKFEENESSQPLIKSSELQPKKIPSTPKKDPPETPRRRKRSSPTPKSTPRKSRKKNIIRSAPKNWESIYSLVEELRKDKSAPVDSDGGEVLAQRDLGDKVFRFQVLIALMLSSQTKDKVVGDAMRALQLHGLTVEKMYNISPDKLNQLIYRVGFHNNKTKYIKSTVKVLKEEYDCDIPPTAEEIMKLSGVGPKMAFIVENIAWGRATGIGVDTHMHRMFNELNWVSSKNPEETRLQLESWLPKEKWTTVNYLWVGFGQEVQQYKSKLLEKTLICSRPMEALLLVKRLGLDYKKEAIKAGLEDKLQNVLNSENKNGEYRIKKVTRSEENP